MNGKKQGFLSDYPKYTDGVILGRTGEYKKGSLSKLKTIIDNLKTHIAVVAPTRSGKGVGIINTYTFKLVRLNICI